MIKSISLRNFQSHKKSHLDLSPGVNAIIGESDSGKTAILRSVNWVVNNRPLGDSFRSRFKKEKADQTIVTIAFSESGTIERTKSNSENTYELIKGKNKEVFKAFDKSLPKTLVQALNFSEVNIQKQMDAPFLLSESSGEIARYFNKIVNLEKIDIAMKNASGNIQKIKTSINHEEKERKELNAKIKETEWVDEAVGEWGLLNLSDKVDNIIFLLEQKEKLEIILNTQKEIKKNGINIDVDSALSGIKELTVASNRIESLQVMMSDIDNTVHILNDINNNPVMKLDFISMLKELEEIEKRVHRNDELKKEHEAIYWLINSNDVAETTYKTVLSTLNEAETELSSITPDTCPLCGQMMPVEFKG